MSFLPGSLTPALLRSCHRKVISHSDGHLVVGCRRKQKEPITQSTRNRREQSSRFKVMFYVIGSENSKSGSALYSSRRQNQRRGGAVRHFRCTDTVSDETDLWWNIGIQLYHHYTDTSLIRQDSECLSLYSEFQRAVSMETKKDPSTGQDIQERFINRFWKTFFIYLQKKLSHSHPVRKISFQVVARETKLFMRASAAIFKTILQVVAGGSGVLVSDFRKNLSQWQPTRKAFLEAFQEKIQKNNSAQVGQNFENYLPDNLSGIKNDLQPSWSEVKIQLLPNLGRS